MIFIDDILMFSLCRSTHFNEVIVEAAADQRRLFDSFASEFKSHEREQDPNKHPMY